MKPCAGLLRTLLVLAAGCSPFVAAQAFTATVTGSGWLSLDNGASQTPIDFSFVDHANGSKSATGSGEMLNRTALRVLSGASGIAKASASAGAIHASVEGLAFIASGEPNVPTITHGTPRVVLSTSASFSDTVTLESATLPLGAEVQYRISWNLHADTNRPGHIGPTWSGYDNARWTLQLAIGPYFYNEYFPNALFTTVPPRDIVDFGFDHVGKVGDRLSVYALLGLSADNRAGYYTDAFGQLQSWGGLDRTIIDASNTLGVFITSLTPGLDVVADSGHVYALGVPEPGTAALMLGGLGIVGLGAGRRPGRG